MTAGAQTRDASSAAWARGGIGSDDIPSRNSAAMYPDGFVPFINGDIDDRYGILGYRTRIGEWAGDFSQTYGYNRMRYNISHTLNASIANLDLLARAARASARQQLRRRRLLLPPADHQRRLQPLLRRRPGAA